MILGRRVQIIQSVVKQHVALAAVANVTNTNVYAVRVRIDVHVIINGFPVDPVIQAIRQSGFSTHPNTSVITRSSLVYCYFYKLHMYLSQ